MNINTVGNALTFRKSVVAQINEKGIGPIITEHLPDDMHHGDHKKAIIYKTTKGIVIAFENTISKYNRLIMYFQIFLLRIYWYS